MDSVTHNTLNILNRKLGCLVLETVHAWNVNIMSGSLNGKTATSKLNAKADGRVDG
jgi:hypothetical protein